MKLIIATDSEILRSRLLSIFSEISNLEIVAFTKGVYDTIEPANKFKPDILIIALHNLIHNELDELMKIKKQNKNLRVIVLSNNISPLYIKRWQQAGADHVFDQAFQFKNVVDVLCDILYRQQFNSI